MTGRSKRIGPSFDSQPYCLGGHAHAASGVRPGAPHRDAETGEPRLQNLGGQRRSTHVTGADSQNPKQNRLQAHSRSPRSGYICGVSDQHSDLDNSMSQWKSLSDDSNKAAGLTSRSVARRRRRTDWRLGGTAMRRWSCAVLSIALFSVGAGVLAAGILSRLVPMFPIASTVALWIGLAVAIAFATSRSRPAGLFRFHPSDIALGALLGVVLRLVDGWLSGANSAQFPSDGTLANGGVAQWMMQSAMPAGLIGPFLEELFFRAVILITVYEALRRSTGVAAAGATAVLASAGGFVLLHGLFDAVPLGYGIQLFALGVAAGLMVMLTGRVWGAVAIHMAYNVVYLVVVAAGSSFSQ